MQITRRSSSATAPVFEVLLETEEEKALDSNKILEACDPYNYGGDIKPLGNDKFRVTIYID